LALNKTVNGAKPEVLKTEIWAWGWAKTELLVNKKTKPAVAKNKKATVFRLGHFR